MAGLQRPKRVVRERQCFEPVPFAAAGEQLLIERFLNAETLVKIG